MADILTNTGNQKPTNTGQQAGGLPAIHYYKEPYDCITGHTAKAQDCHPTPSPEQGCPPRKRRHPGLTFLHSRASTHGAVFKSGQGRARKIKSKANAVIRHYSNTGIRIYVRHLCPASTATRRRATYSWNSRALKPPAFFGRSRAIKNGRRRLSASTHKYRLAGSSACAISWKSV